MQFQFSYITTESFDYPLIEICIPLKITHIYPKKNFLAEVQQG